MSKFIALINNGGFTLVLPDSKAKRYERHIIMPEIGQLGQKKLLDSHVEVIGNSVSEALSLFFYLTAVGIGTISYNFQNKNGINNMLFNLKDLNPDITIIESDLTDANNNPKVRIIIGNMDFVHNKISLLDEKNKSQIPLIIAVTNPWQGLFYVFREKEKPYTDIFETAYVEFSKNKSFASEGFVLSSCFAGALGATEAVKCCLNLGDSVDNPLFYDLMSMRFSGNKNCNIAANKSPKTSRHFKNRISDSKVLIIGTGGLGSPVAFALALIGVGTIGLVDGDHVDLSNLNRQILHATSRIGMSKVESACWFLKRLNPSIRIIPYYTNITKENALDLIKDYDVIIACLDNLPSRYLLNDTCFFAEKPLVEAGVLRLNGMSQTILPKQGPCYRCIFPEMPSLESIPSPSQAGILGSIPGVMGFLEAAEVVKLLIGADGILKDRILLYDAMDLEFRVPSFRGDYRCPLCGENPSITTLQDYETGL